MNAWYLMAFPAWFVIFITALSRLHDMGRGEWMMADHFQRLGLIGAAAMAFIAMLLPFSEDAGLYVGATWRGTFLAWSWALIWVTKRGDIPWWDFILGVHREVEGWSELNWKQRLRLEVKALRESFRARRNREVPTVSKEDLT